MVNGTKVIRTVYREQPHYTTEETDQGHVEVCGREEIVINTVSHHVEGSPKGEILVSTSAYARSYRLMAEELTPMISKE